MLTCKPAKQCTNNVVTHKQYHERYEELTSNEDTNEWTENAIVGHKICNWL